MPDSQPLALPAVTDQAERLIALGLAPGGNVDVLRAEAARLAATAPEGALLALSEAVAPPSMLAPLLRLPAPGRAGREGETREGFVVTDMTDVDSFRPTPDASVPDAEVYLVHGPDRGDDMRDWSPEEASPTILSAGRSPLTLNEGIHWALQLPQIVEAAACYMTIGSRLTKSDGAYDSRTPAIWISGGTGRDTAARKGAPKVGWCWWRNHHTWLGIASCERRTGSRDAPRSTTTAA